MGLCSSSLNKEDEDLVNQEITKELMAFYDKEDRKIKILLLGAANSGKSTVMKQMRLLNDKTISEEERMRHTNVVRENTLEAIQMLSNAVVNFNMTFQSDKAKRAADHLCNLTLGEVSLDHKTAIQTIWMDEGVKEAFNRASEFNLLDSASYFLLNVERTFSQDYIPTTEDVLRARTPTFGVRSYEFRWAETHVSVHDVGGQRGQRKKWISCFEDVTSVIFIASLAEFDQHLEEDPATKRMEESIKLFQALHELRWFENSSTIIFFNKEDVFREKLNKNTNLSTYFPEYMGSTSFDSTFKFIKKLYFSRANQKQNLFAHITRAIDTTLMERTIESVKHTVMVKAIRSDALL